MIIRAALIKTILGTIRVYQVVVSPLLGPACRFYPSCSEYAQEAIRRHGFLKGTFLSGKRILKCHPFHPGGVDPVPKFWPGSSGKAAKTATVKDAT